MLMSNLPARVRRTWANIRQLNQEERLILAKLLLDSIVTPEADEEADWQQLSLTAFEADWDNPEDAIYDNWRELYDVPMCVPKSRLSNQRLLSIE